VICPQTLQVSDCWALPPVFHIAVTQTTIMLLQLFSMWFYSWYIWLSHQVNS